MKSLATSIQICIVFVFMLLVKCIRSSTELNGMGNNISISFHDVPLVVGNGIISNIDTFFILIQREYEVLLTNITYVV